MAGNDTRILRASIAALCAVAAAATVAVAHERNGFEMPFHADASRRGSQAAAMGFTVDMTPAPGAVAWWSSPQRVAWTARPTCWPT